MTLKKANWGLFGAAVIIYGIVFLTGCNKKSSETSTGGGASNQSVVTLKGSAS